MFHRLLEDRLRGLLGRFPAVALLGPCQVGKTTLALGVNEQLRDHGVYLDLERPSDISRLADPEHYFAAHEGVLVILDEVDDEGTTQSAVDQLWVRGGFPDSFLAGDAQASYEWRLAFIQTYLERDIPALGPRIPAETLRRFWTMLAHGQGGMLNAARLAAGLGVNGHTVGRYLDLLVDLLLVRRLSPWATNVGKRLVRSPKVYVRDSGLVHALLGIPTLDALLGHPVAGGSWEGMVIENLIAAAPPGTQAWFYRTAAGAEIDLVLETQSDERWAIEIKRSLAPTLSKGFRLACEDINATQRKVVYPGVEEFSLGDGVQVMSVRGCMAALRKAGAPPAG